MSEKQTDFGVILRDLKVSFRFATKNIVTFFLGMLGVIIVSGLLLVLIAVIVFVPLFVFGNGLEIITSLVGMFESEWTITGTLGAVGVGTLMVLPILSPFFVAIGALFGMGREIVESEGTTAEGVFTWYRSKFAPLAAAGLLLFLTLLGPPGMIAFAIALVYGGLVTGLPFVGLSVFSAVWLIISAGMLSMMIPAVIDGVPVLTAYKQSVTMSIVYFDRVFGVWIAYVLLGVGLSLPPAALSTSGPFLNMAFIGTYGVIVGLFAVFVFVPSLVIALTRVYLILSGDYYAARAEEHPNIGMIGGA